MKLWSSEHTFSHSWQKVTEAAWRKYPNEHNTNVTAIDVIDRKLTNDGRLLTTRIFGSHWNLPRVITALFGMPDMCYAIEHSEVDMKNEKMTLKMINYTFWGILAVEEKLVYQPNKENRNETYLTQGAKISVNGISFSSYFEEVIMSNFEATSTKGRKALEQVINKIKVENILSAVTEELQELSADLDKATTYIDSEFNVSDRLQSLSEDLDKAAMLINSEFQIFSNKLNLEFSNLIRKLDTELNQISIRVNTTGEDKRNNGNFSNMRLTAAVKQAGITVKSENS